jgi:hypothetical protein
MHYLLEYGSEVISEVPLAIKGYFHGGNWIKKASKEFREARNLLKQHGLYC